MGTLMQWVILMATIAFLFHMGYRVTLDTIAETEARNSIARARHGVR